MGLAYFTYIYHTNRPNVGKIIPCMEPMVKEMVKVIKKKGCDIFFWNITTWWSVNFNGSWHKASKISMCKRRHGPVMVVSGGPGALVQWESTPQVARQMSVTNKTQIVVIPLKRFLSMVQKSQTTTWDEKKTCKLLDKLTFPQLVIAGFLPSPRIHV